MLEHFNFDMKHAKNTIKCQTHSWSCFHCTVVLSDKKKNDMIKNEVTQGKKVLAPFLGYL